MFGRESALRIALSFYGRFFRRICASKRENRGRRSPITPGNVPQRPSRFGYQTPPPGVNGGSISGTTTLEHTPKSFSGMFNRLFSGMEGEEDSSSGAISDATAAAQGLTVKKASGLAGVGDDVDVSTPPRGMARGRAATSPVAASGGNSPVGRFSSRSPLTSNNRVTARSALPSDSSVTVRGAFRGQVSDNNNLFSDDESESDAGHSTDRESMESTEDGINEGMRRFVGRDGVVWRQARGSPADTKARRDVVDSRVTSSSGFGSGSGVPLTPEARVASAGGGGWAVAVERCYVMLGCHKNQPLMLKVRV